MMGFVFFFVFFFVFAVLIFSTTQSPFPSIFHTPFEVDELSE